MPEATEPMLGNTNGETIEMQPIEPSRTDESHAGDSNCILDCVKREEVDIKQLKEMVKLPDADLNFNNNKDKKTALHWAAKKGLRIAVNVLLEAGADIKRDIEGNTALHYAVQRRSFAVFKLLLPPRETLETRYGQELQYSTTKGGKPYIQTKSDCYIDMATSVNVEGFNVLDLALEELEHETEKIVRYIVRETNLDCLLRLLRNNSKGNFSSPFRGLIKKMPGLAKEVMDKCITSGRNETIIFHYEFLDDTFFLKYWPADDHDDYFKTWEHCKQEDGTCEQHTYSMSKMKNNHPLNLMIKCRKTKETKEKIYQQLLDHPLVKAVVRRKWNRIGVKFHLLNLAFYLIYLAVLTVCVSTTVPPYVHSQSPSNPFTYRNTTVCQNVTLCQNETSCQNGNACKITTVCHDTTTCLNKTTTEAAATKISCHSFESHSKSMIVDLQYFVIALSLIMILKEVYQLVRMYGRNYFRQNENYVEMAVYLSSVLFVVNVTDCKNTDYRTEWQWVFGTFSVFMAWINLLAFAKKFDRLGIYAMMFGSIIKTFLLNVFPIVAVCLMAFAIAFTCVHQDQVKFANVWHSLLTTTSFMISGFDYEEFLSLVNNHDIALVSYIIYSLFQFVMTIVIINLMVSVAVENVQEIHKDASEMNTVLQIEYFLEFEGILWFISSKLRNICNIKKFEKWLIPEPHDAIRFTKLKSKRLPVQEIMDLIDRNKAKDKAKDNQGDFLKRMKRIETKLTELTSIKGELLSIETMLTKIANKEN